MNIEAEIEGQRVTGCITYRTKRGLTVEITSPYQGLSTHLTIPYFAAAYSSFDGAHGMETADEMLRNLYLTADYIAKHRQRLAAELKEIDNALVGTREALDDWSKELQRLRKQLKAGDIDPISYQQRLVAIRKQIAELDYQQSQQEWAFVKGHLPPSAMSCDVQQVLASIRR